MALDPSNSSNLEQLALKGLIQATSAGKIANAVQAERIRTGWSHWCDSSAQLHLIRLQLQLRPNKIRSCQRLIT